MLFHLAFNVGAELKPAALKLLNQKYTSAIQMLMTAAGKVVQGLANCRQNETA
jgi:hypothetical protein